MADYTGSNTPVEIRDCWETPKPLFLSQHTEFRFVADVAASSVNALCDVYLTEQDNALTYDWSTLPGALGGYVWCNPPYSDISPWVYKAIEEAGKGVGTVMLLPVDMSVGWFKAGRLACTEVRVIIGGRIAFINAATKKPVKGNNKGSMFLIFRPLLLGAMQTTYADRDALLQLGEKVEEWGALSARTLPEPVPEQDETAVIVDLPQQADGESESVVVVTEPVEQAVEQTPELEPAQEAEQECEEVACPKCGATCRDFTEEADFIGWHGHCASCDLENVENSLPTSRNEIEDLRVLSALEAAFGLKDEYSFSESRVAHTWVADSFEHPTIIIVPADVLAKAMSAYQRHQVADLIDSSGCTESQVERLVVEPEAKTIEPELEPEAEPREEQPACVASVEEANCPDNPEDCPAANCVSEEQETVQEVADSVTDALETVTEEQVDLEKALSESQKRQMAELIDNSGCTESQIERLHAVSDDVLWGASEWCIPVIRELIESVKESGLENIREIRVEMRLIAERQMREFFNPRSGAPRLGCSKNQIQWLCDVLWEVEHGYFGPFDKSDLMPVFNKLVGYVRRTSNVNGRLMRVYLQERTVINGHVCEPESV